MRIILYQGPKSELQHTRKTLGTLSWVFKEDDYSIVIRNGSPCSGSVSSLLKLTRHYRRLQPEQVVLRSKDSRSKPPLVTNFYISVNNTKLHSRNNNSKDILQLSVTVVMKNTRRQKRTRQKPRRLVVTTAITTRKH